jgi:hypothetical protein
MPSPIPLAPPVIMAIWPSNLFILPTFGLSNQTVQCNGLHLAYNMHWNLEDKNNIAAMGSDFAII